jgi:5-hydroxyisourate hydrolase-like protein (transthyretin family)
MRIVRPRIGALAALTMLLATFGCSQSTTIYPLGKLSVQVLDANNAPVQGVAADLYKMTPSGKVYWRASSTSSDGIAIFGAKDGGVIEGDYVIHVSFTTRNDLAPGETNDRPVTVKAGDDTVITFRVVASVRS